ncbi:family 43 glycosylhydrolase [Anaerocolumna sp. MB42-C2]|uniref:family 43 glycosylhydrolase n=1 Tax=Anaerocolumna sp. MB42-C2 TaxID=3070997 RepID=UPI0027E0B614|nr:family 43 glycosylhydrolase [Anaerocolumna sp. MB42-C2]WMJ86586.1 family 43 glycosylhydrolase [Anaerocolumna sp. MB42-C2]
MSQLQGKILIYTRKPQNEYTESLSNSIHFAYSGDSGEFELLNRNYGILFAQATVNQDNVIREKGLKNPYIFRTSDGAFGITAVRISADSREDEESKGHVLLWTSKDLISFQYRGLLKLHEEAYVKEAVCEYNEKEKQYVIHWQSEEGNHYINSLQNLTEADCVSLPVSEKAYGFTRPVVSIAGIIPGNILAIDEETGSKLKDHWSPVYHKEIRTPASVTAVSAEQLKAVRATAVYSDGSTHEKKVQWDFSQVDFSIPGTYIISGKVVQEKFMFPLARGYADPVILPWNNKYYYIATNDNKDDIGIYVREADTISGLFAQGYTETIILDLDEERGFNQTFWAPEFHVIGGDLYLLFAVSGSVWGPQCHMMKLKKGGNILRAADWKKPVRIKKVDGTYLTEDGITLDMTYFRADGVSCVVWSYRKGIGTPLDTGSMLYIATVEESDPTILTSEPVLLSRPLFGWENVQGTINNEGPYPLITEDTVYITYSGGAACGYTYALGLLSIPRGSDFLDINAWKKASTPVLSYFSVNGVYGPGHNSFFRDNDETIMIMYHGEEEIVKFGTRCTAMHRVHINHAGVPLFDVAQERDLNTKLTDVTIKVIVE